MNTTAMVGEVGQAFVIQRCKPGRAIHRVKLKQWVAAKGLNVVKYTRITYITLKQWTRPLYRYQTQNLTPKLSHPRPEHLAIIRTPVI